MKRLIYILAALMTASCVYPFSPDVSGEVDHSLVVSGDIVIGEKCQFNLGYVLPLSDADANLRADYPKDAKVLVEDGYGKKYHAEYIGWGKYEVDLTKADPKFEYCLKIELAEGKSYSTALMEVQNAPEITNFRYSTTDSDVSLLLSMDGGDHTSHFFWDYEETWEFHADFIPTLLFVAGLPDDLNQNPNNIYTKYPEGYSLYYTCWSSNEPAEPCFAETEGQSSNKIIDNCFYVIPRTSKKLMVLYSIEIVARGLSKDAYGYWLNMTSISNNTGSLFSPIPSEVRGNVFNDDDPSEMVYGYVEATQVTRERFFLDNNKERLYKQGYDPRDLLYFPEPNEDGDYQFDHEYNMGNAPVYPTDDENLTLTNVYWAPTRCVDCRASGGNKVKPSYWPNSHE